jgi:polyhydroxyalkanoate synthesis regulator phasin
MSNIEHLRLLIEGEPDEVRYEFFMLLLDSLKDLHEENTKLQSEVAKHNEYIKNLKKEIKELKNENNL